MQPILMEIDLSQTTSKGGAGLEVGPTYLVLYHGEFHVGKFSKQWYGLNFEGIYDAGAQYDSPGTNYSAWQRVWKFTNAKPMSAEAEPEFARMRREYAINHGLTSNKQTIDDSSPLEAFVYHPKVPAMPKQQEDDWEEEEEWD